MSEELYNRLDDLMWDCIAFFSASVIVIALAFGKPVAMVAC
jgi:hypothetical protein